MKSTKRQIGHRCYVLAVLELNLLKPSFSTLANTNHAHIQYVVLYQSLATTAIMNRQVDFHARSRVMHTLESPV